MGANVHAGAFLVGDRGVLVEGASGSGKSILALSMIAAGAAADSFARLVSDDRVELSSAGGRLVARAPETIAGLAELRGHGIASLSYEPAAVIDLVVRLVPRTEVPRHPDPAVTRMRGIEVPLIVLPANDVAGNLLAIRAALDMAAKA